MLAKAVASEVDAEVYNVKLTDIATSAYINTGSNNVQKLFAFIRQKANNNKKIVVILDELDALFGKRDEINGSHEDTKIVNAFLTEMSGFDTMENVIFIGTTNLLKNIDPAVIRSGRLTTKVKVDLPNTDGLKQIYQIHLNKLRKFPENFITRQKNLISMRLLSDQKNFLARMWKKLCELWRKPRLWKKSTEITTKKSQKNIFMTRLKK